MITQKFNCQISTDIIPYIQQFNCCIRFGYNRLLEGNKLSIAGRLIKDNMNNIDLMDLSLITMAISKAKSLISKKEIVIFGGKRNLERRTKNQITNEQWKKFRSPSILLRGSSSDPDGNRKAKLDIENNQVEFWPSRNISFKIKLPTLSKKQYNDLLLLQKLCENHKACFSLEIGRTYVSISYDEINIRDNYKKIIPIKDRILSLDLNPNYIGLVICDENTLIYKEIIDLKDLNQKRITSNKRKYEILQISKHIMNLTRHYRCNLAIEKLNMKSKNHQKGKAFNRLVNNYWNKNILINNLHKWSSIYDIKLIEIICAYSSFVGQMTNSDEYDSIAAAIEINKRAQLRNNKQKYEILPKIFDLSQFSIHWKNEIVANGINNWLEFYNFVKKSKSNYRYLFIRNLYSDISFSLFSVNSMVFINRITQNE